MADFTFPAETRVAVAGDWESLGEHVFGKLRRLRLLHPDVRTILHLGDLRWEPPVRVSGGLLYRHDSFLPRLERELAANGHRVLLTPGNHDDWTVLKPAFLAHPERPRRLSPSMWALPRGFRFTLARRSFLSFGGAVSVDADRGAAEAPTDEDVARAAPGGAVDVLLTHEPPNAGISEVEDLIARSGRWSQQRLQRSADSRRRIDRLVAAVRPTLTLHGHMHVAGRVRDGNGHETIALPVATKPGNIMLLTLPSLTVSDLDPSSTKAGPS
ncbi:metallophosphoesterase [Curtobacterium sp. JUb34]|uniref:metallophosphoesterase n=1 Tax=Curtobacterium sp. JUb34 TaxID=2485109 RepID=UPI00161E6C75|nr:metallophosphoesterase [Curtobacterium sp. JUb34]